MEITWLLNGSTWLLFGVIGCTEPDEKKMEIVLNLGYINDKCSIVL